jgi:hypothetical protein
MSKAGRYEFINDPEDDYKNVAPARTLGLTAPQNRSPRQYSQNFFMMAVCNKCKYVQFFRLYLVKGAYELWLRKPQKYKPLSSLCDLRLQANGFRNEPSCKERHHTAECLTHFTRRPHKFILDFPNMLRCR